jgi:hypothetical protein
MQGSKYEPTHEHPFDLLRVTVTDDKGKAVYRRPLWAMIAGAKRREVRSKDAQIAYGRRYDIEHFFRFGKQKLLLDAYQTPELKHEEDWWQFVPLAYTQLYLANGLAELLPKPWERYLPSYKDPSQQESSERTPTQVQRSFANILEHIGTPANPSKPRGNPMGRTSGTVLSKREALSIHFKSSNTQSEPGQSISNTSENELCLPNGNDIALILNRFKSSCLSGKCM